MLSQRPCYGRACLQAEEALNVIEVRLLPAMTVKSTFVADECRTDLESAGHSDALFALLLPLGGGAGG